MRDEDGRRSRRSSASEGGVGERPTRPHDGSHLTRAARQVRAVKSAPRPHAAARAPRPRPPGTLPSRSPRQTAASRTSRASSRGEGSARARSAALVLGATEDPRALAPLCQALGDASELVRAAAARSLGTLGEVPRWTACRPGARHATRRARHARREAVRTLKAVRDRPPRFYLPSRASRTSRGSWTRRSPGTRRRAARKLPRWARCWHLRRVPRGREERAQEAPPSRATASGRGVHPGPGGGLRLALVCMTYPEQSLLGRWR